MEKIVDNFNWNEVRSGYLIKIGCDGSSKGNPGAGGYGWYHSDNLYGFGGSLKATNNAIGARGFALGIKKYSIISRVRVNS